MLKAAKTLVQCVTISVYGRGRTIPVVHEHVGLPQPTRWDSDVANISVLRLVPLHVDVLPLLQNDRELFGVVFLFFAGRQISNSTKSACGFECPLIHAISCTCSPFTNCYIHFIPTGDIGLCDLLDFVNVLPIPNSKGPILYSERQQDIAPEMEGK